MKKLRVAGIYREDIYSHNALDADRAILEESLEQLGNILNQAVEVQAFEARDVARADAYSVILSMAQSASALDTLTEFEKKGALVLNSPQSIRACYRVEMVRLLKDLPVSLPLTEVLDLQYAPSGFRRPTWIKRGDFHALSSADVALVQNQGEFSAKLEDFKSRKVSHVVLQDHIVGDVHKFYGVKNLFFECRVVDSCTEPTVTARLSDACEKAQVAADRLGLEIYGGDCVFDSNGNAHIIDMNDWPSFRTCRTAAAKAIAKHTILRAKQSL